VSETLLLYFCVACGRLALACPDCVTTVRIDPHTGLPIDIAVVDGRPVTIEPSEQSRERSRPEPLCDGCVRRRNQLYPHRRALNSAQHGDRDAFAGLYTTFREPVTRYVSVRMRDATATPSPTLCRRRSPAPWPNCPPHCSTCAAGSSSTPPRCSASLRMPTRRGCAAYAIRDHANPDTTARAGADQATRPGRITFVPRNGPADRRPAPRDPAVLPRRLPRDAAARLMGRSTEAVRCLKRRAIRHLQTALTGPAITA
jgi:RNA polymerase sigma-70 factor, ECF subfamily